MGIVGRVSCGAVVFLFAWVLWTRTVTLTAPPGDPARLSIPNLWELDSAYTFRATCLVVATAKTMVERKHPPYTYPSDKFETWCLPESVRPWESQSR